jgi:hypothetical protein
MMHLFCSGKEAFRLLEGGSRFENLVAGHAMLLPSDIILVTNY